MRRLFLFLSINVFLMLVQYSIGAPRKIQSLENSKIDNIVKRLVDKLETFIQGNSMTESEELNEAKKKFVDALELISKSEESNSNSDEQENNDNERILSQFINIDHQKILENSDEN